MIAAGQVADYDIPSGSVPATRFWPKYDCDADGQNCTFGESGGPNLPCPAHGCSPPVDSKFEATFGADGLDWYDSSQVDGWSLPYYMEFNCEGDPNNSGKLNCQTLTEDVCPSQDVEGAGNVSLTAKNPDKGDKYAGCYSPCALLTYKNWSNPFAKYVPDQSPADQYCCGGAFNTNPTCSQGPDPTMTFTQVVHSHCDAYAWAYDDAVGLKACPTDKFTVSVEFYDP